MSPLSLNLVLSEIIKARARFALLFGSPPRTANFRGAFSALQIVGVNSFMEPPGQGVQLPNAVILPARNFKRPCPSRSPAAIQWRKRKRPKPNRDATHIPLIW